ncbi:glycosyl hydrolase family protein with chitinaseinsertion domain [Striga asiatica]|uniref:Glycosyl hydrolase family protein with chitinaseinsertion domain n=1 Tax=Striga asiatica TaxID=4170 RepID=A0A5A7PSR0_STRAF|nr:glycosyl hydrolase family protein with chitinaseinsertion domain [Striga asiatica]
MKTRVLLTVSTTSDKQIRPCQWSNTISDNQSIHFNGGTIFSTEWRKAVDREAKQRPSRPRLLITAAVYYAADMTLSSPSRYIIGWRGGGEAGDGTVDVREDLEARVGQRDAGSGDERTMTYGQIVSLNNATEVYDRKTVSAYAVSGLVR